MTFDLGVMQTLQLQSLNLHYLTFDLRVKVIQNNAHYPLHLETYTPAKFEVATPNGLEGDAFASKYTI